MAKYVIVDIEAADGPTPGSGVMTEFGAVDLATLSTFHGVLWDAEPVEPGSALFKLKSDEPFDQIRVVDEFEAWLGDSHVTMFSDNPAFDFMWMAHWFDSLGRKNPFGFSARRIGDLYAGLSGNWRNTNAWKKWRKTKHTHNPVDDALGNAEALRHMLERYKQPTPW